MKKSSILVMISLAIAAILYYLTHRFTHRLLKEYNAGRAIITEEDWECA